MGYVPSEMLQALSAFLEICYLIRDNEIDEDDLDRFDRGLERYHHKREIFRTSGVRPTGFSLPRQHALMHYRQHIEMFGAPNGVCSSITESRHITAVKKPWRRSNRYHALGQMLTTNQRLDKLIAARAILVKAGKLPPAATASVPSPVDDDGPIDERDLDAKVVLARTPGMDVFLSIIQLSKKKSVVRGIPSSLVELARYCDAPHFPDLVLDFLRGQLEGNQDLPTHPSVITEKVRVFTSAVATFKAPSDDAGIHGWRRERIRCTPAWRGQGVRRDCAFVVFDSTLPGMRGLRVVRVRLLFSFSFNKVIYPCALVEWFETLDGPDPDTVS